MTWAAAYGPTPGSARSRGLELVVGELGRARASEPLEVHLALGDRARERGEVGAPVAGARDIAEEGLAGVRHHRGGGKARPRGPSGGPPAAGSPRCSTRAVTIRRVADQAQFVVQIVFTTSSKTVGLCTMRPAPRHPRQVGVAGRRRVEGRQVRVEPEHVAHARDQVVTHVNAGGRAEDDDRAPGRPGSIPDPSRPPAAGAERELERPRSFVQDRRGEVDEPVRVHRAPRDRPARRRDR